MNRVEIRRELASAVTRELGRLDLDDSVGDLPEDPEYLDRGEIDPGRVVDAVLSRLVEISPSPQVADQLRCWGWGEGGE